MNSDSSCLGEVQLIDNKLLCLLIGCKLSSCFFCETISILSLSHQWAREEMAGMKSWIWNPMKIFHTKAIIRVGKMLGLVQYKFVIVIIGIPIIKDKMANRRCSNYIWVINKCIAY